MEKSFYFSVKLPLFCGNFIFRPQCEKSLNLNPFLQQFSTDASQNRVGQTITTNIHLLQKFLVTRRLIIDIPTTLLLAMGNKSENCFVSVSTSKKTISENNAY